MMTMGLIIRRSPKARRHETGVGISIELSELLGEWLVA